MPIKFFLPLPGPFVWVPSSKPKPQGPPPTPLHEQGETGSLLSALGALLGILLFFVFCVVVVIYTIFG